MFSKEVDNDVTLVNHGTNHLSMNFGLIHHWFDITLQYMETVYIQ